MAKTDRLKRYLDAGVAFTEITQQRAEEIVRELVKAGDVQRNQSKKRVDELVERSRQTTEGLRALVEAEVRNQVAKLGLVPKSELDEVKAELAALKTQPPAKAAAPVKKAPAKAPVKKAAAPAKKAVKAVKAVKKATP